MTVKSKRGRRRYILFEMTMNVSRENLIHRANIMCGKENAPYVVQSSQGMSIVRCAPNEMARTIKILSKIDPGCKSLITSGTLKTIRDRYPGMRVKAYRH